MSKAKKNNNHICEDCGRAFSTESGLKTHKNRADKDKELQKRELKKIVPDRDSEYHVYVCKIQGESQNKPALYVGQSNRIIERLMQHLGNDFKLTLGNGDGEFVKQDYDMLSLKHVEPVESKSESRFREHELLLETAIEHDTTRVFGGV